MDKDIRGYDMAYCGIKEMCRNPWSERIKYLCIDMTESKNEGKYRRFERVRKHTLSAWQTLKLSD